MEGMVGGRGVVAGSRACLIAALGVCAGLAGPGAAFAPADRGSQARCDRYAAPDGSDARRGTLRRPVRTAPRLEHLLRPGEIGCFRGGTYSFDVLKIETRGVTLTAFRGRRVVLRGDINVLPRAQGAAIVGMVLDGSGGRNKIGPRIFADDALLRSNSITNRHAGICVHVTSFYSRPAPRGVRIHNNRIHDCGKLPATNHQHGIYVAHGVGTSIEHNWIYGNADRGIQLYPDAQHSVVRRNVIHANGQGINIGGDDSGDCSNSNLIARNVISDSALGWNVAPGSQGDPCWGNRVRDNCVHAGAIGYTANGGIKPDARSFTATENLVAPPRFVDEAAHDYRLRRSSVCRRKYDRGGRS